MAKKKVAKTKSLSFEASLEQLEAIVSKLEGGQLSLAESLEQYELGVKYLNACYGLLSEAERRIELVGKVDSSGKAHTRPFNEAEDESLPEKAAGRSRRRSTKSERKRLGEVDDGSSLF